MKHRPRLVVVVPVYHNAPSLDELHRRLVRLEESGDVTIEIVYVDDGSRDDSYQRLLALVEDDRRARVVRLSRNFGSFTAIRAGLDHVGPADCVAVISADLQDPPERLVAMLDEWRAGAQVVLATRNRRADGWATRLSAALYYRLLRRLALPEMPPGGFDFLLIDRQVAGVLRQFREHDTSLMGLVLWLGFRRVCLPYDRLARPHGRSMWSLARKLTYCVDSFVAFTATPLRFVSALGIGVSLSSFAWCAFVVFQALVSGAPVQGWSSLMAAICFLGGVQLLGLGIVGEYLWRSLEETRDRPLYVVDRTHGFETDPTPEAAFEDDLDPLRVRKRQPRSAATMLPAPTHS